jgi:hypothetical protein
MFSGNWHLGQPLILTLAQHSIPVGADCCCPISSKLQHFFLSNTDPPSYLLTFRKFSNLLFLTIFVFLNITKLFSEYFPKILHFTQFCYLPSHIHTVCVYARSSSVYFDLSIVKLSHFGLPYIYVVSRPSDRQKSPIFYF